MNAAEFRNLWSGLTPERKREVLAQSGLSTDLNDESVANTFLLHPHYKGVLHEMLGVPTDAEKVAAATLTVGKWTLFFAVVGTIAAIVGAWAAIKALPTN